METFCDYCGEVITNYHNSVEDKDNIYDETWKRLKKLELKQIKKPIKRIIYKIFGFPKIPFTFKGGQLIFCNEEHYEKFKNKLRKFEAQER